MNVRFLAKCRGRTAEMFPEPDDEAGIKAAKDICDGCPIKAQCLADALDLGEEYGVWGGMTPPERFELLAHALLEPEELEPLALEPGPSPEIPSEESYIQYYGLARELDDPGQVY